MTKNVSSPKPIFSGWPKKSILTVYTEGGVLKVRKKAEKFDLSDEVCGGLGTSIPRIVHFGLKVDDKIPNIWNEDQLKKFENNIEYDLSFDGYCVTAIRVKGIGLKRNEELLWRLEVDAL